MSKTKQLPPQIPTKEVRTIINDMLTALEKYPKQYTKIVGFKAWWLRANIVHDPEYIKYILQTNNKNFTKSVKYKVLERILGKGLLTSEGDFWRKQRRLAQPAFHRKGLDKIADIVVKDTEELFAKWDEALANGRNEFNYTHGMARLTISIVSRALFGNISEKDIESVWDNMAIVNEVGAKLIRELINLPEWIPTPSNRRGKKAKIELDKVINGFINKRQNNKNTEERNLLAMLMDATDEETGEKMSDKQLRDEIMTIFLAGHETTVVSLSWTLDWLSRHKTVFEKIRQEANEVFGNETPTLAHCRQLIYTSQVIYESMRLSPPVYLIGRRAMEDDEIDGFFIPKKTNMLLNIYGLHRHPQHWEAPNEFKPERFADFEMKGMNKFLYFPFGGGPRLCIGNHFAMMEMQLIVAMFAQRYDFELLETPILPDAQITLKPKPTVKVRLKKR